MSEIIDATHIAYLCFSGKVSLYLEVENFKFESTPPFHYDLSSLGPPDLVRALLGACRYEADLGVSEGASSAAAGHSEVS